jgi:hypothetical protein
MSKKKDIGILNVGHYIGKNEIFQSGMGMGN